MMDPEVVFRGHAFLQINVPGRTLLCDPWASGQVFNDSWALLREVQLDTNSIGGELDIWISHEHPDHLHFPTLKQIRALRAGRIRIFYRRQSNSNVREALEKLGFEVVELTEGVTKQISDELSITIYTHRGDCAAIIKAGSRVIFNQNDCALPASTIARIVRSFSHIDMWAFQFSLAGYYANHDETHRLDIARNTHLKMIQRYFQQIKPSVYVPFASYIYFAKPGNSYLNAYRVRPEDVLSVVPKGCVQIPWFDRPLRWSGWEEHNAAHIGAWREIWSSVQLNTKVNVASEDIVAEGARFVADLAAGYPSFALPTAVTVRLRESGRSLLIDVAKQAFQLTEARSSHEVDVEVGDDDFLFFMKFPWGADTLNITGNIYINSDFKWRWLAYLKHVRYTHGHVPALGRSALAIGVAALRTAQHKYVRRRLRSRVASARLS